MPCSKPRLSPLTTTSQKASARDLLRSTVLVDGKAANAGIKLCDERHDIYLKVLNRHIGKCC